MAAKRRKVDSECRIFNEKWTEDYFFIHLENKPICLICSQLVAVLKEHNIKQHYALKHADKYEQITGNLRKETLETLKRSLQTQQSIFTKGKREVEGVVEASYIVSHIMAKHFKCFSDGEIVKECMSSVAEILFPDKKEIISNISLSRYTVPRRLDHMANNIEAILMDRTAKFVAYSV